MTSSSGNIPIKCPTCGESNEGDMQFCIFCGSGLIVREQAKVEEFAGSAISSSSIVTVPSMPVANALVCTVCHRSDPLHGQYCVFCGGRTSSAALDNTAPQLPIVRINERGSSVQSISGEFPYTHAPQYAGKSTAAPGLVPVFLMSLLGIILGGSVGIAGVYGAREPLERAALDKMWTGDGLVIYTTLPGAAIMVENHDEKSVFAGITGKTGTLSIANISPGSYRVSVMEGSRTVRRNVVVSQGTVATVGYPDRIK